MTKEAILEKLKEVVKPYSQNHEALNQITDTTDFTTDLQVNSANLIDVFLDVEEAFGIELDNASLEGIANVNDAVNAIALKIEQKEVVTE